MTTASDTERDLFAAQYALGVLDSGQREAAAREMAADPLFAGLVTSWQERLSPLLAIVEPIEPDEALWERINRRLDEDGREGNVHQLKRRLTAWRVYAMASSAVAAALLLAVALDLRSPAPAPAPAASERQPVLVANVTAEDRSAAFVVSYDPSEDMLLVSPALAAPAPGHDHELWLILPSGVPASLGLIVAGAPHRLPVPASLAAGMKRDATVAISVEPPGGSPTGQPTGPVIATGKLVAI